MYIFYNNNQQQHTIHTYICIFYNNNQQQQQHQHTYIPYTIYCIVLYCIIGLCRS